LPLVLSKVILRFTPEQSPCHRTKAEPAAGVTDNCKVPVAAWVKEHFLPPDPQSMPAGVLVTLPEPLSVILVFDTFLS
jgi:hypothetical protein